MFSQNEHFERINLKPNREYEDGNKNDQHFMVAESRFHRMLAASNRSSQTYKIDSVDLIKNQKLWTKFKHKQEQFEKAGKNSKPLMIFHGTPAQNIDSIVKDNFKLSKITNGRVYGDGVYFSECPEISIKYSQGWNQLILCQVLLGNSTKGKLSPGFDSTEVPNKGEERCFAIVIPDVDQIFPCYVINFSQSRCAHLPGNHTQPIFQKTQAPSTKLIAGHYRLRRPEEFVDKLIGFQKERGSFEVFLNKMGLSQEAKKTYMKLTQMYIREEIHGGQNIYFHHADDADESFMEVITPGTKTVEPSAFQNGSYYNCIWQRFGSSLGTTLFKQCTPQPSPITVSLVPYTITREFTDKTMITTYTEDVFNGFKCVLIYLKIS